MVLTPYDEALHFALFAIAAITPLVLFYLASQIKEEKFRAIVFLYATAFVFSALRWVGGSVVALNYSFSDDDVFETLWFLSGLCSALIGIFATLKLHQFLKERESMFLGRT